MYSFPQHGVSAAAPPRHPSMSFQQPTTVSQPLRWGASMPAAVAAVGRPGVVPMSTQAPSIMRAPVSAGYGQNNQSPAGVPVATYAPVGTYGAPMPSRLGASAAPSQLRPLSGARPNNAVAHAPAPAVTPSRGMLQAHSALGAVTLPSAGHASATASAGTVSTGKSNDFLSYPVFDDFMSTPMVRNVQDRFEQLLVLLEQQGVFAEVRPANADDRVLRIAAPFCGGFFEAPTLAKFLVRLLDSRQLGDVSEVEVIPSDVLPGGCKLPIGCAVGIDPRVHFRYAHLDLSVQEHPPVDLILGMHPEITRADTRKEWQTIIKHCVAAAPISVLATLKYEEAETAKQDALLGGAQSAEVRPGLPQGVVPPGSDLSAGYDNLRYCNLVILKR